MTSYVLLSLGGAIGFENILRRWVSCNQKRARIVETFFSLAIGLSALSAIIFHRLNGLSLENGVSDFGRATLLAGLGFFIYHLHRVIYVPGFAKSLILHHILMILCIGVALLANTAYFYILLASIPIASAAVRNIRWFWKMAGRPRWYKGALTAASAYCALESIPPIFAVIHFFLIGIHQMTLSTYMWTLVVVPGLILSGLTFYYSALFFKKTVLDFHES